MKITIPNALITRNDKEISDVLVEHFTKVFNKSDVLVEYFTKVFNTSVKVDMEYIKAIPEKNTFEEIRRLMTFDELSDSLHEWTWHKAGGFTKYAKSSKQQKQTKALRIHAVIDLRRKIRTP